jgi:methylated-DNA-[protein]-cysteine S-methyltransferase
MPSPPLHATKYVSPLGIITLVASEQGLRGLYFEGQCHWPKDSDQWLQKDGPRFESVKAWLDAYFSKQKLPEVPELDMATGTDFQRRVWQSLLLIPSGQTWSYKQLAEHLCTPLAVRAVGAAVGRNPLSLILPCHRVIGSSGALTGCAGGVQRKQRLLQLEATASPELPLA